MSDFKYLNRLAFAAEYFSQHDDDPVARAAFVRENIFDVIGCAYLSLWRIDESGHWVEVASDGVGSTFGDVTDWPKFNLEVMVQNRAAVRQAYEQVYGWSHRVSVGDEIFVIHLEHTHNDFDLVELMVITAVRMAFASPGIHRKRRRPKPDSMSQRQATILRLMGEGLTYAQIAADLGFSESLIKQEARHICRALGAKSRFEAVEILAGARL